MHAELYASLRWTHCGQEIDAESNISSHALGATGLSIIVLIPCGPAWGIPIGQITPEQVIDYVDKRLHAITSETLRKELTLFSRV